MYIVRSTKFGRNVLFRNMKHAGRLSLYTASSKSVLKSECCNSGRLAKGSVSYSKPNRIYSLFSDDRTMNRLNCGC